MKRILPVIIAILIAVPVSASQTDHISDYAGLLEQEQIDDLNKIIMEMEYYSNNQYYLITTYDDDGIGAQKYAENHLFSRNVESGASFLIDLDAREYYIATVGDVVTSYTDDLVDETIDKTWVYVAEGDYYEFFKAALEDLNKAVSPGEETEE